MREAPYLVKMSFHAMGSPCHIQFYVFKSAQEKHAKSVIKQCLSGLEQRYSRYRKDSLISLINQRAGSGKETAIDAEMLGLLNYAEQCYQESDGLFDITSGSLRNLWGVDKQSLPSEQQLANARALIGWQKIERTTSHVYLPIKGMQLDFGGIVKEYAADSIAQLLKNRGIESGIIELGGDIKIIGSQPNGNAWPIAIRNPSNQNNLQLSLHSGSLASSGDYERFQMIDGVRYSHILNPKTGKPTQGLQAVSIISEHCVVSGSLATLAMLKGKQGLAWLKENKLDFFCCEEDGTTHQHLSTYTLN